MNYTKEIKDLVLGKFGMDYCGIAPVERFTEAPEGKRPEDLLPGAKSVIVFGVRILDGALQGLFRKFEEGKRNCHGIYATYASTIAPNFQIMASIEQLTNIIEQQMGGIALPTTTGPFQDTSSFSQRRAAVAAGLAQYGYNGYAVTKEYGPRVRWGSVITTLELDYDEMDKGPKICDPEKCGYMCVKRCPVHAIKEDLPEKVTVGGQEYEYAKKTDYTCKSACYGLLKETSVTTGAYTEDNRVDLVDTSCISEQDFNEGIGTLGKSLSGLQLYPNWKCDLCLAYCPLGGWEERFEQTGLSKGNYDINVKHIARIQNDVLPEKK